MLPIQSFFIYNGEIKPVNEFIASENEGGIYEVLRVVNGIPLFAEEHIQRFFTSAQFAQKKVLYTKDEIVNHLSVVIQVNRVDFGNLLISCKTNLKLFFIAHKYPGDELYSTGVNCGLLAAERNTPNAKVFQTSVRKLANELIQNNGYYEVLLVDKKGRITEGSRSNVFFVRANEVITPPGNEVLLGITRQKTIELVQSAGMKFTESDVFETDLKTFDAAFITGTSPKILPLNRVGNVQFNPGNRIVQQIIHEYNRLISEYIKKKSGKINS